MKKSLLAVSLAAVTGLGVSHNAQADAYAYAYNRISNLQIVATTEAGGFAYPTSSTFDLSNSAGLSGFASIVNGPIFFNSPGAPYQIADAVLGSPTSPANNPAANGNIGNNYAKGDAEIKQAELDPGSPPNVTGLKTETWAVAESYLKTVGNGGGSGTVGSTSTFVFTEKTTLEFSFDAVLRLIACVDDGVFCTDSNSVFPTSARAASALSFVLTDENGNEVFDWAIGDAPVGSVSSVNPFEMNTNRSRDQNNPGLSEVNESTLVGGQQFKAKTIAFDAGTYTLSLNDNKNVRTQLTNPAPEPATLALMGIGLLGGLLGNRRKIGTSGTKA